MIKTPLQGYRQQFPEYNDLDDEQLAEALYQSHYADVPVEEFRRSLGLYVALAPEPQTISTRIDDKLNENQQKDPLTKDEQGLEALIQNHQAELETPEEKNSFLGNAIRRAAERGSHLLGHAIRGNIGQPGEAMRQTVIRGEQNTGNRAPGSGMIVFGTDWGEGDPADGKFRVRWVNQDEWQRLQQEQGAKDILRESIPEYLTSRDFGYEPQATPEKIKQSFEKGEVLGTMGNVFAFGLEQGIGSVPDMVAALNVYSLPAYVMGRADEIGQVRAENSGAEEGTLQDQMEALPFTVGSALLERFGAGKMVQAFGKESAEQIGQDVLQEGFKYAAKRVTEKGAKAGAAEGLTEALQEGVLEYLGERLGTDAALDFSEAAERGLFGALGGSSFGSMVGVSGGVYRELEGKFYRDIADKIAEPDRAEVVSRETDPRIQQESNRIALAEMADRSDDPAVKKTVARALAGREMGVQQKRQLTGLLDRIQDEYTEQDPAADDINSARQTQQQAHANARAQTQEYMREPDPQAGELLEEWEYLPDQMGEARIIDEMAVELDRYGSEVESRVDQILRESETNKEAIERLEILKNEQSRPAPSPESQASPQDPWSSTANETRTPAADRRSAPREGQQDRRQDVERRQRIESMTPAQIVEELYTDPLTGLYNERAFNEDLENVAWVASIDADGLGGVNDHLGHDAGDGLLKAVGIALEETGIDAYHKSGDEFYLLGDNQAELEQAVDQAVQTLSAQVLEATNGKVEGINITTGIGQSKNDADTAMESSKKDRAAKGLRNPKGTLPPGGVLYSKRPLDMAAGSNYVAIVGRTGELPINANREYVLGNGKTVRIPNKPVSRRHVMNKLERAFGVRILQGRIKKKGVLGYHIPGIGSIRIKNANDLEVAAHEVAHWLDSKYPWINQLYRRFQKEIRSVSYEVDNLPREQQLREGWAEFIRLWMTQDYMARQATPGFYDAFMNALDKRPEMRDNMFELQELMHAWFLQGRRARLKDRIGNNISISDRFHAYYDQIQEKFLQKVFDELRPFKEAERVITGGELPAAQSGYKSLRLARGAHGVMQAILHKGTVKRNGAGDLEFSGKGIHDIFKPVSDRMEDMMLYMVARRAQELIQQGRENHIRPDEIAAGLEIGAQDAEIVAVFDEWLAFNERMMDFYQQSGLLSNESRTAIEEMNKNYVPFNRIIDSAMGSKVNLGGSPFMRLRGGTSNINDVFESIVGNTSHLVHMALINRAKMNFYKMVDNATNQMAGLYATPIPKDMEVSQVDRDQVLNAVLQGMDYSLKQYRLAKTGVVSDPAELVLVAMIDQIVEGMDDTITFFRGGKDPTGNVDYYLHNGEKKFYEIADPLLMEAINHIGPRSYNLAANMLGGFANVLRKGVTVTPTFQIKNFIRDTMNAFTLSKGKIVPAAGATKALLERLYTDEHYWEYMLNGGGFASMADADGINRDRVLDSKEKLWNALDTTLASFEYANRIAEYKALRKKGYTKRDAALAGREISSDFAMRGSSEILRWFTISIPFLNARLQGLYRNARELARLEDGKLQFAGATAFSYALRSLMAITIPSLMLYMWNRDDERYQKQLDYVKDLSWIIYTGDGEDDYVMIPKPFETGMLWGTLPERMIEYYDKGDEKELADALLWMATETFQMNMVPQAYKVWDDLAKNKSFTGAPIIPEYLKDIEPMEQYRFYTSDAMIALGRKYNISPIKAEYIVRGHFGTLGSWALGMADYLVGDIANNGQDPTKTWKSNILMSPFVNDGPLRRTDSEEDLWEMLRESQRVADTVRMMTNRSPERVESYISQPKKSVYMQINGSLSQATRAMQTLSRAADRVRTDNTLSADEKREAIHSIMRERNAIAREVRTIINPEAIDRMIEQAENEANQRSRAGQ